MNTKLRTRSMGLAALALTASMGLAACGSEDADTSASDDTTSSATPSESETPTESETPSEEPAADGPFGPGCAGVPTSGEGSVEGMADDPVATAASNNPLLKTLVAAVSGQVNPDVNLVDTLNGSEFTVFAPVDDAFAKLDAATVEALSQPENAELLSSILTYHVVPGQILPADLTGDLTTVEGDTVTISGSGDMLKVNDSNVICGGVHTANATVYLIDTVLSLPEK